MSPIQKKNDKQLVSNYRPISLLPICSKILEKIIFNNMYRYLVVNDLISKHQSGFRPGDSTTNQLLFLVHTIHLALDEQREVRSLFLDISKAWKGYNTSKLYEELGWESLTDRRWYRRLLQFYKIINDLAPSYLKDIIPPLRGSLYGHPRHVFNEFRCHSFTFMHSFFRIVSNPGTILAENLRSYHLFPNSKKLY